MQFCPNRSHCVEDEEGIGQMMKVLLKMLVYGRLSEMMRTR
jgi:hypothetical protein